MLPDSDTWSFKTNRIAADGSFYGYGNDLVRGFDVYRFDGAGLNVPPLEPTDLAPVPPGAAAGTWPGSDRGAGAAGGRGRTTSPPRVLVWADGPCPRRDLRVELRRLAW